jgi:hypothetical protein
VRGLTLDTGALIAAERDSRRFWAYWKLGRKPPRRVTLPAPVLAQAWRRNTASIAHLVQACTIEPLDFSRAKAVGLLLAKSGTSDIVDAMVVLGAVARRDAIVTSDPADIERLLDVAGARLPLIPV